MANKDASRKKTMFDVNFLMIIISKIFAANLYNNKRTDNSKNSKLVVNMICMTKFSITSVDTLVA